MTARTVTMLGVVLLACGPLGPPRADGGGDGGATGGGGPPAAWQEVTLAIPGASTGPVQRLVARPGELFAAVGHETLLHSRGGQFSIVTVFDQPVLGHMNASKSGRVAYTVFQTLLACAAGCDDADSYEELRLPRTPIGVCSGVERLGVMTTATDAGAVLFAEGDDGGWSEQRRLNLRAIAECARLADDTFFVAGLGAVFNSATGVDEVPDTGPLARDSSLEAWTRLGTDGTRVYAASVRGAVARRDELGAWSVQQVLAGEITALAVEAQGPVWVAGTGLGLSRWDGTGWHDEGAGPAQLLGYDALALEGSHVYVGGTDAQDRPRVFRRAR